MTTGANRDARDSSWMVMKHPPPPNPDMNGSTRLGAASRATASVDGVAAQHQERNPAVAANPRAALTAPHTPTAGARYALPSGSANASVALATRVFASTCANAENSP